MMLEKQLERKEMAPSCDDPNGPSWGQKVSGPCTTCMARENLVASHFITLCGATHVSESFTQAKRVPDSIGFYAGRIAGRYRHHSPSDLNPSSIAESVKGGGQCCMCVEPAAGRPGLDCLSN